jgi:carboxypeptidase T
MASLASSARPSLVTLETLGTTFEGRAIAALRIAPKSDGCGCRILILGGHHAREWIAAEVPYLIAERLVKCASDPSLNALFRQVEVWVVPVLNPDGSDYSHRADSAGGDRLWRKNRRPVGQDTAGRPIYGVDLNRNYDVNFRGGGATSGALGSENYPGEQAFSECETRAIRDLVRRFEFHFALSYHSFGQEVLYPFGFVNADCDNQCAARLDVAKQLAENLAAAMDKWNGVPYCAKPTIQRYPTSGDCADWLLEKNNTIAVTVELPPRFYDDPDALFMLDSSQVLSIFEGAWAGVMRLLEDASALTTGTEIP